VIKGRSFPERAAFLLYFCCKAVGAGQSAALPAAALETLISVAIFRCPSGYNLSEAPPFQETRIGIQV